MSTKIDIQNPKKYFGKEKGDTTLARVAHVNHALEIAEQSNGEQYQLQMPYVFYPEFSMIKTGNKITYGTGQVWESYKVSGYVYPGNSGSNVVVSYLCSLRTRALNALPGPLGAMPYALTGTIANANGNGDTTTVSTIAPGALVYDYDLEQAIPLTKARVELNNQELGQELTVQHIFLITEADSSNYSFEGFVQFEFMVTEGTTVEFFLD